MLFMLKDPSHFCEKFLEIEQNINDWNMGQVEIQTLPSLPETYL